MRKIIFFAKFQRLIYNVDRRKHGGKSLVSPLECVLPKLLITEQLTTKYCIMIKISFCWFVKHLFQGLQYHYNNHLLFKF
jgi:hypothetical protein